MMAFIDVPGYGPGNLTVEGNFAHYIDRIVLGTHNYAQTKTGIPKALLALCPPSGRLS